MEIGREIDHIHATGGTSSTRGASTNLRLLKGTDHIANAWFPTHRQTIAGGDGGGGDGHLGSLASSHGSCREGGLGSVIILLILVDIDVHS